MNSANVLARPGANESRRILVGLQSQRRQRRFTLRCCHPERLETASKDPAERREVMQRDPSTSPGMTRARADGNLNPPCSSIGSKFLHKQETAAADPSVFGEKNSCRKAVRMAAMADAGAT